MLLLDTHAFVWFASGDSRLSSAAAEAISATSQVFVSAVSAIELAIKAPSGALRLGRPAHHWVPQQIHLNGFLELPVTHTHALGVAALPYHHRDPWDRLLVAQALAEGLTLVTRDASIRAYPVPVLW